MFSGFAKRKHFGVEIGFITIINSLDLRTGLSTEISFYE